MNNKAHLRPKDFDSNGDIIPMSWKEEKGDLISRKWLTDAIRNRRTYLSYEDAKDVIDLIDNAPTVEPEKVLVANVSFDEDKLKDIVQTEVIEKIKSGELVIKDERPQNEYFDMSKLRLMTVEECAGHTIDYAMGWKACVEWIKKGGAE